MRKNRLLDFDKMGTQTEKHLIEDEEVMNAHLGFSISNFLPVSFCAL